MREDDPAPVPERRLTRRQAAILGAYTGVLLGPVADLFAYTEELLGRPVMTHELADPDTQEKIEAAAKSDVLAIAAEDSDD